MVTLGDSLVSTSARELPFRKRPDLSARKQTYLGRSYWVVKEPVGLNYFRFQEEEFAILNMLDGQTSLDEIKERFEEEFPPQKITLEELQQFLGMLHRSGLVVASVAGQGHQLRKRRDERRRKEVLGACTNILCIRFKGFDPERILNWLYPRVSWMFSPAVLISCMLLWIAALALITVEFDVFRSKLPGFYQFFSFYNAMFMAVTLGFSKILHEFGHGLSCKHFRGECHEIGIMILVLTPCMYCNVSDSWMLPNKWHRAGIGAAGIFVEVTLAAAATFIWWFSEPGLLNHLCLNIMFVSSVSTILFNGNPLLRYDGYYVMADIVEIPNLRQKATTVLGRKLGEWFLGIEPPEDPFIPQRNQVFFAFYSIAASMYRWFVMASIMYFLFQVFKPYGLEIIGQGLVLMSLYGLVGIPAYKVFKFFYVPGRVEKVKKPRMFASLAGLVAIVAAIMFVPLPHSVMSTLEIQARNAEPVYVDVTQGGRLEMVDVKPGQQVTEGQRLARLSNVDVDLEIARLTGQRDSYRIELENLRRREVFSNPKAFGQVRQVEKALQAIETQLNEKRVDRDRLTLRAPKDGTVLPPPRIAERGEAYGQLSAWSGTPLEPENIGAHLQESTLFCRVGDLRQLEAILVVDQTDIDFVREVLYKDRRPQVEIKLDELPHDVLKGEIEEIAEVDVEVASQRLSTKAGGELATITDPKTGIERPQSTSYQARVPLVDSEGVLRIGLRGQAKIQVKSRPLGERIWRFVSHTFKFKL